ncbi:hypothetical protein [Halomarina litorea]|uniref:hypothetical protein n=1 Tax=Halomarina litorea TaxID=2961595 RepID=UPI0020C458A5|nr:hypothetical protein [Halomarina sp. BCD28]
MVLTSIVSSTTASAISLFTSVGLGVGGVFVAAALLVMLGHMDLRGAAGDERRRTKYTIAAFVLPLSLTFAGMMVFQTMQVLAP